MSIDTLNFPKDIAEEIGLGVREINYLKRLGCRFFGRKTCVRWVREFISAATVESSTERPVHPSRSSASKSCVSV